MHKILFLIIALSYSAQARPITQSVHESIPSILNLDVKKTKNIIVNNNDIIIRYHGRSEQSGNTTLSTVNSAITYFLQYLDMLNIGYREQCIDLDLDIYEITNEELNNRSLMNFLSWHKWNNNDIYGIYDSVNSRRGVGSIFFSGTIQNENVKLGIIAHEVSHFIQEVYCIDRNQESMSRDFERFYRDKLYL